MPPIAMITSLNHVSGIAGGPCHPSEIYLAFTFPLLKNVKY